MLVSKVVKCRFESPTKRKLGYLNSEWNNYQNFIELEKNDCGWLADKVPIYASYKQQARRYWKKFKKQNFPISISNQRLKIKEVNNKLSKYWIRIPIKSKYGGIWLAIKPHCEFPKDYKLGESKLLKKDNEFWLHIVIRKEVEIKKSYSSILAIDIGEKILATVLLNGKPIFYGREIRGIRRHYSWLRKRLGNKKLLKKIKQIEHKEHNCVNSILHEISKRIVSLAYQHDSLILLGDLKGIQKYSKGKRFNRIVHSMPYHKLTQMIEYKASWIGMAVVKMREDGTSKTCSECSYEDVSNRRTRGLFRCRNCSYEANADFNAVKNIEKRSLGYMLKDGAVLLPMSCPEQQVQEKLE
jgi:putative transposase